MPILAGQRHQSRQRARHCHHAQRCRCLLAASFMPQQQTDTKRLVQHPRKGMRRIDRHRRQQRIDLRVIELQSLRPRLLAQLAPPQHTNLLCLHRRQQLLVPASVLRLDEAMDSLHQTIQTLLRSQPALIRRLGQIVTILDPLQKPCNSNFDKLIQIARCNCKKLHSLQQRICLVLCLFEHPLVKPHPRFIPAEKQILNRRRGALLRVSGASPGSAHTGLKLIALHESKV